MKKNLSEIVNKILAAIAVLTLVFIFTGVVFGATASEFAANPKCYTRSVFTAFMGSKIPKGYPKTAWQVEQEESEGVGLDKAVMLHVNYDDPKDLSEVWINISDFYGDNLTLSLYQGSTGSSKSVKDTTLSKADIKFDEDGWFKLYDKKTDSLPSTVSSYFTIKLNAQVMIRELVFVQDTETKGRSICSTSLYTVTIGETSTYKNTDDAEESKALFNEVKKIIDEQKTFKLL